MINSITVIFTQQIATCLTTPETRKVTAEHERCEQIFPSQTHNGGCIFFIMATHLTPVKYRHDIIDLTSASIHPLLSTQVFSFSFTSSSSLSLVILFIIIDVYRHRCLSSAVCLFIMAIDISVFCLLLRLLFIHLLILKNTLTCQMPSKRTKQSLKNQFYMRYSEFCLQSGCLTCGVC